MLSTADCYWWCKQDHLALAARIARERNVGLADGGAEDRWSFVEEALMASCKAPRDGQFQCPRQADRMASIGSSKNLKLLRQ
jgi:hypothetical protein